MELIFDLDGVLFDLQPKAFHKTNRELGTFYSLSDWRTYNVFDSFPHKFAERLIKNLDDVHFYNREHFSISTELLKAIREVPCPKKIWTYCRTHELARAKLRAAKRELGFIQVDTVVGDNYKKGDLNGATFIEDSVVNLQNTYNGVRVLVRQPWNRDDKIGGDILVILPEDLPTFIAENVGCRRLAI